MEIPPEIRLGSTLVTFEHDRRFVFRDVHRPDARTTIDDADVAELILFLHKWSKRAAQKLKVTSLQAANDA